MSLLRLLSTGRSLVGFPDGEPRYHVTNQKLPKFNSKKNPFRAPAKTEGAAASSGAGAGTVRSPESVASAPSGGTVATAHPTGLGSWLGRIWHGRGPKLAKRAISALPQAPVQGELSLDRIKVVRNDLSETDLDIKAAKSPTIPGQGKLRLKAEAPSGAGRLKLGLQRAARTVPGGEPVGTAWNRMSTRLFGAGKS